MEAPKERKSLLVAVLLLAMLVLAGCGTTFVRPGETTTQTERAQREGAERVRVDVQGGLGDLTLERGDVDLFAGEFRYNLEELAVSVNYRVVGDEGILTIRPDVDRIRRVPTGNVVSEWTLQFADTVPLEMDIHLGLGNSDLDFSELNLSDLKINSGAGDVTINVGRQTLERLDYRAGLGKVNFTLPGGSVERLDFEAGAGDVEIDLTGDWQTDLDATIERGLGQLTLRLPDDVGVWVDVDQGLGDLEANGFTIDDGAYVNDAYGDAAVQLEIEVGDGLGNVELILE